MAAYREIRRELVVRRILPHFLRRQKDAVGSYDHDRLLLILECSDDYSSNGLLDGPQYRRL